MKTGNFPDEALSLEQVSSVRTFGSSHLSSLEGKYGMAYKKIILYSKGLQTKYTL